MIKRVVTVMILAAVLCVPVQADTVYVTAENGLNIRSMPNTLHDRVNVVPHGAELEFVSATNDPEWACVLYDGRLRYVNNNYISKEKPEPIVIPDLYYAGVINWGGYRWTWYSERVLPGGGLAIPGRHTDAAGYVRDADSYLCLASGELAKGTIVDTPFGSAGKVYDYCGTPGTLDVYVNW